MTFITRPVTRITSVAFYLFGVCLLAVMSWGLSGVAQAAQTEGLISHKSPYSVEETLDKFEQRVLAKGLKVFARIDHSAGAKKVGQDLRPTQLLIFGNPQGGTPLMLCQQTFGMDLPLKALVWQDEDKQVWLSYNDIDYLTARHQTASDCGSATQVKQLLSKLAQEAIR